MKTTLPPAPLGHTWISISAFLRKYMSVMPQDLFMELNRRALRGADKVTITTSTIYDLDDKLAEKKAESGKWSQCAKRNDKGKEYEKEGKIALAIKTYEKNIEGDCCPALHSFTRLMVLYRREKRLDDERRVLERALEVFSIDGDTRYDEYLEKWTARLLKIESLTEPK